jgi:hypothetical protein
MRRFSVSVRAIALAAVVLLPFAAAAEVERIRMIEAIERYHAVCVSSIEAGRMRRMPQCLTTDEIMNFLRVEAMEEAMRDRARSNGRR